MDRHLLESLIKRLQQFYADMHERITLNEGDIDTCYAQYLRLYDEVTELIGVEPPVVQPSAVREVKPIEMAQQLTLLSGQLLALLEYEYSLEQVPTV